MGSTHEIRLENYSARFSANILWIQGERPTNQPYVDQEGNVLLWNGDAYSWNVTVSLVTAYRNKYNFLHH